MVPNLTSVGHNVLLRALNGEGITFTKVEIGDGELPDNPSALTEIQHKLYSVAFGTFEMNDGFAKLVWHVPGSMIEAPFYFREYGIYVADPSGGDDLLFAYAHYQISGDEAPAYVTCDNRVKTSIYEELSLWVGQVENVSAVLVEASSYCSLEMFRSHERQPNAHGVTPENINAANKDHTHKAADITGVLPVIRGGTGVSSLSALMSNAMAVGTFTGDGSGPREIILGFAPKVVILMNMNGITNDDIHGYWGGIAIPGHNVAFGTNASYEKAWNDSFSVLAVTKTGFKVNYNANNKIYSNRNGYTMYYIAIR